MEYLTIINVFAGIGVLAVIGVGYVIWTFLTHDWSN